MTTLQRCTDCGDIIYGGTDFREGRDDPQLCNSCNDDRR